MKQGTQAAFQMALVYCVLPIIIRLKNQFPEKFFNFHLKSA